MHTQQLSQFLCWRTREATISLLSNPTYTAYMPRNARSPSNWIYGTPHFLSFHSPFAVPFISISQYRPCSILSTTVRSSEGAGVLFEIKLTIVATLDFYFLW